ncbi:MAG: GNAT family N-acetyltransferase [Anaerolineae bacterium]|nr:GNAT family N-acetyltransferase [Anaerolineae bacterium]
MNNVIETDRLRLRPFAPDDAPIYAEVIFADPDVTRYLPASQAAPLDRATRAIAMFADAWAANGYSIWAVERLSDGLFVGACGLMNIPDAPEEVELAYEFGKVYWGQGYATEAARACLRYGFEVGGLSQIVALAIPENAASRRVMEKLGMTFVDINQRYYRGTTLAYYTLARDGWGSE